MKKFFTKEVVIGIAVLVSLALLFIGIEFLKGVNVFKPANFYKVQYDNVTGLAVSAPVTVNGFQVGLVRDISYDYNQNGVVVVELSLDKDFRIPKGSTALLASDLLGVASVQLSLSDNSEYYEVGENIPGVFVKGLMGEVGEKLMPSISSIVPKLDSIVGNLNTLTANPALNAAVTRLDNITANLEQTTTLLNKMMANQLPSTLDNVNVIAGNLNTITSDLTSVSASLKTAKIDSTLHNLNETTSNLAYMTGQLTSKDSSLGLLLNDRGLYDHLDNTIYNIDSLLIDLRHNPKKYVNFKLF